jgi:photosystem II stability/assembly factor-like uncharacterized protein
MNNRYIIASCVLIIFAFAFFLQNSPTKLSGSHSNDPTYFRKLNRIKSGLPKSGKPDEATKWFYEQRAYPGNQIPFGWRENALSHIQKHNLSKSLKPTVGWNSVGPYNVGGRVRAIAIANVDPNIVYASSVSGGVFKSTNGGSAWTPTSDQAANLAVSSIVIDPTNNNIIYAGTGEGFFNYDAIRGEGVLKSTDAGASWTILKNFSGGSSYPYYINDLYLRPDSVNILYAASNYGLFKTTNSGSSWVYIHQGSSSSRATQIVSDPTNPLTFFVCYGNHTQDGIYKTTNGGANFTKLTTGFPTAGYNRIALSISKSNPAILCASLDSASTHYTHSIQKSTDGGASWFAVGKPTDTQLGGSHLGGQGWYNNVIAVHPTDPTVVYAAGINLFKSTNGGTSWAMIAFGYSGSPYPYVHVDHHEIVFHPTNPSIIYFGNDGGVFKTTNGGTSFSELNNGFATTQFYSGSVHPTQEIYYGGSQDNGTLKSGTVPNWSMVFGGDGGATAVDYNTPSNVYTEYVELCIMKSTNGGAANSWVKSMTGIPVGPNAYDGTTDRVLFIAPYVMDPNSSGTLVAGTYKVYRTTNGAALWTSISGDLTGDGTGATGSKISAIAIAKSSSATIYIGTTGGTASSRIQVTTNTGTNWSIISQSPLPNRWVTSIAIDPTNASNVWVGYSGYNFNTPTTLGHIFHSTNVGTNWTDVSGDLPDVPVNTIILDPASLSHILVGTDLGVFETQNGGINWVQQNNGMANVVVMDMDLRADGYVFAATHGRGMFKLSSPLGVVVPSDTIYPGDANHDAIVDARDLLPIARYYGNQGSARINTSLNWTPQTLGGPFSPIDAAYADCNGNGTVEKTDVLALIQNWYRSVGSFSSQQVNTVSVCEELLNSMSDIPTSGVVKEIRNEIVRYRSQLLGIPNEWILEQNYPNPFNPSTNIKFNLPDEAQFVRLVIYDVRGRAVREFARENVLPGYNSFEWDGKDENGMKVSSGIYYYSLKADKIQLTNKMVFAK